MTSSPAPRIVVADDSPTLRKVVASVLTREGFDVVAAAEDGLEAVQAAHRFQPDAVVMDVQMPRLTGYVAARLLKEDWATADIPVVLLTSLDAASDRYWGAQAGADRYLTKDFQAEDLGQALREVLAAARRGTRRRAARIPTRLSSTPTRSGSARVRSSTAPSSRRHSAASMTALAATCPDLESTMAGVLEVIGAVVDSSLAGVVLVGERTAYVTVDKRRLAGALPRVPAPFGGGASSDDGRAAADGAAARADRRTRAGLLGEVDDPVEADLATFLSMPLAAAWAARAARGRGAGQCHRRARAVLRAP